MDAVEEKGFKIQRTVKETIRRGCCRLCFWNDYQLHKVDNHSVNECISPYDTILLFSCSLAISQALELN